MFNILLAAGMFIVGVVITLGVLFLLVYKHLKSMVRDVRKLSISLNKNKKRLESLDVLTYGLMTRFNMVPSDPTEAPTEMDLTPHIPSIVNEVVREAEKDKSIVFEKEFSQYRDLEVKENKNVKPLTREEFSSLSSDEKIAYLNQYKPIIDKLPNKKEVLNSLRHTKNTLLDDVYNARCN